MIINGVEIECFDTADAVVMEHYEAVINRVTDTIKSMGGNLTKSQYIRKLCQTIFEAFNELFGEGTDRKIFGDSVNMNICLNAYYDLIEGVNESYDHFNADFKARVNKQSTLNREQRRNQAKNKRKKLHNYPPKHTT